MTGICPFCGVPTTTPHTQEGCIQALHEEIARMRAILEQVQSAEVPGPALDPDEGSDT